MVIVEEEKIRCVLLIYMYLPLLAGACCSVEQDRTALQLYIV